MTDPVPPLETVSLASSLQSTTKAVERYAYQPARTRKRKKPHGNEGAAAEEPGEHDPDVDFPLLNVLGDCDAARTEPLEIMQQTFRLLQEHKSVLTYMRFTATVENALEATDVRGMLLKGGFLSLATESFLLLPFRIRNKIGTGGVKL